ncbi:MAG: hypothetical protein LDLANPLL_00958 [Turneriella sp.]|nr:hypothetical protein [Turneriella sp.]
MSETKLHISLANQNLAEEALISKKPTYKGGSLFEVKLVNAVQGSGASAAGYKAGAKLRRLLTGETLTSRINNAIIDIDKGLLALKKIISEIDPEEGSLFNPAEIGYSEFVELRKKYQTALQQELAMGKVKSADGKKELAADNDLGPKNRGTFILLGWFLGIFGAHNFYAGYTNRAVAQLLITVIIGWFVLPLFVVAVWVIVELLTVKQAANGVPFE